MLVLSRKIGQEIVVGDAIRITITKVSGNRVSLGVEAPEHVRILRGELSPIACAFEKGEEGDEDEEVPDALPSQAAVRNERGHTTRFIPTAAR